MHRALPAHRLLWCLLFATGTLLLSACTDGSNDEADATAALEGDRIVATVNDEPITETMLDLHIMRRTGGHPGRVNDEERETLLLELVEMTLIAQDAREHGLDREKQVQAQIRNMDRAVLAHARLENLREDPIPEEELARHYEDVVDDAESHHEYHARHILVDSEEEAREIVDALEAGEDFAELADAHSRGPSAPRGGDLGWFLASDMVEPFAEAVRNLEPGDHTADPVQTRFGWHVIRLEDRRKHEPPPFDEVARSLQRKAIDDRIKEYLEDLRNSGDVTLYRPKDNDDG